MLLSNQQYIVNLKFEVYELTRYEEHTFCASNKSWKKQYILRRELRFSPFRHRARKKRKSNLASAQGYSFIVIIISSSIKSYYLRVLKSLFRKSANHAPNCFLVFSKKFFRAISISISMRSAITISHQIHSPSLCSSVNMSISVGQRF